MVWARRVWEADAREWHLPDRWTLALAVIPVVIALAGILAVPFRPAYRLLANEDGITEWLQVVLIVVCLLAYVRIGWVLWRSGHRALALLFFTGAAGMFFVGGEEISWGQRIFGWATPDVLEDINNQGESNIHNIGPLLRIFNLVVLAVSLAAIVAPLARWTIWRERLRGVAGYLFVPPVALIPAFGFAFAYRAAVPARAGLRALEICRVRRAQLLLRAGGLRDRDPAHPRVRHSRPLTRPVSRGHSRRGVRRSGDPARPAPP